MRSIVTWSIHLGLIFSKALCDIQEGTYCGRSCQLYHAKSLHYFFSFRFWNIRGMYCRFTILLLMLSQGLSQDAIMHGIAL